MTALTCRCDVVDPSACPLHAPITSANYEGGGSIAESIAGLKKVFPKSFQAEPAAHDDVLPKPDMVNHPPHYKSAAGIESIDVIEAFGLGFCLGNVAKYLLRHTKKGDPVGDLKKARWYLDREIARLESKAGR